MNPLKSRFVTACQQVLTLAVVLAVLAPAAGVVSLDVVPPGSSTPSATGADPAAFAAYMQASEEPSVLPAEDVEATVTEHPLTVPEAPAAARRTAPEVEAEATKSPGGKVTVTSTPQDVDGFGAVGVTWDSDAELAEDEITLRARTREGGEWSEWTDLVYHDEHGPDPGSPEADAARPGTDELLVGEVDEVQVQATAAAEALPTDMKLAVVAPGEATSTETEGPALDTATMPAAPASAAAAADGAPAPEAPAGEASATDEAATDGLALQAARYAPRPTIYSRAQWGADERLRDKGSLRYGSISAGFVHHTVNANSYSRAEVPGILRSIYAYHTKSRGWSDVGYNFLVDRYGRIWEGRAGGVDKAVVGAHTLGYNDYSFAMSAIGNFDTASTTSAMVQAYGALMAWKLSLHGVSASDTSQKVGRKYFPAISGHRDAGSTACPGRYLYAKLGRIRTLAAEAQRSTAPPAPTPPPPPAPVPQPTMNLADTAHPDLVVRRASDKRLLILPTRGLTSFANRTVQGGWGGYTAAVASPDLTGDGRVDMIVQNRRGTAAVRAGKASGKFRKPIKGTRQFRRMSLITAVGDVNRDGRNDVVALHRPSTRLYLYLGRGNGAFKRKRLARGWAYNRLASSGDLNGDRRGDLVGRDSAGNVWLHPGQGRRFGKRVLVARGWQRYQTITGSGDFTQDGHNDLVARTSNGTTYVLPGTGRGGFGRAIQVGGNTRGLAGLSGGGSVAGTADADLVGRRGSSLVVVQHAGTTELGRYVDTGQSVADARQVLNAGDWDRDGDSDVLVLTQAGLLRILYNNGAGRLSAPRTIASGFGGVRLLAAVGDVSGDGLPDLMGQPSGGSMMTWPGAGTAGLKASYPAHPAVSGSVHIGAGQWDGKGAPDTLVRASDRFTLYSGQVPGTLTAPRALSGDLRRYNWVVGVGDVGLGAGPDVIVRRKRTGDLYVLSGSRSALGSRRYLGGGMNAFDRAG